MSEFRVRVVGDWVTISDDYRTILTLPLDQANSLAFQLNSALQDKEMDDEDKSGERG